MVASVIGITSGKDNDNTLFTSDAEGFEMTFRDGEFVVNLYQ